ncbi:flagellar assembly protein FliH [Campylobacter sp. RM16192]|uniref:flagellar assembly protein FliH n=1 Tax=Campylobacter sp. RM16192 TaxID=1660080 RepID=UPI0014513194|nr:flagellar assembly protein FliH [Campylobacter sp. RM16192]QCD53271.1 flagellar export apparatus, flagellar assembly protein FliH [Campylobacter sp. RM16192]
MRSSVITNEDTKSHFVESYRFKVLGQEKKANDSHENEHAGKNSINSENSNIANFATNFDHSIKNNQQIPISQDPKIESNFVEELLKRTDELSGNIIKLQMKIENQESEFAKRLENETIRAKEEGLRQGFEDAKAKFESELKSLESRYLNSVAKLDSEVAKFENFLSSSENELSSTAIDIAKEIVKKEISSNSSSVAYALAKSLIKELNEAKKLQIRVNIKDFEFLKEHFGTSENIQILADEAINVGGVILMSDAGNLDGTIEARFEKIKRIVGE